jgi:hypothetical protein
MLEEFIKDFYGVWIFVFIIYNIIIWSKIIGYE